MAFTDPSVTVAGNLSAVKNFSVAPQIIEDATHNEYKYYNNLWPIRLGYYKQIPELKKAIDALAMWTTGKGWTADNETTVILNHVKGRDAESFDNIMWNHIVTKKANGDAFIEVMFDDDAQGVETIINMKNLNPSNVAVVFNDKGMIIGYDILDKTGAKERRLDTKHIFHSSNDRIASEVHGTSVIDACKWVIDARNEAMSDKRRSMHTSTIRVIEVDTSDSTVLQILNTQYASAIANGNVLLVPKGNVEFPNVPPLSTAEHSEWIQYLENFFYQAVGIPKIILGGSQDFTEASSKIGYLTFEQPYMTEQRLLEQDLFNQLGLTVQFYRPVSLKDEVVSSEAANTGQTSIQPNELQAQVGRNE